MNGKAHTTFGVGAGCAARIGLSLRANRQVTLPEVCGWLAGGAAGARLPDLIEPAIHPCHRKFAHSGTVLVTNLAFLQGPTLESWIQSLRSKAATHRLQAQVDPQSALLHCIIAGLLEFLAGALPGVLGGYASHLVCDATTRLESHSANGTEADQSL